MSHTKRRLFCAPRHRLALAACLAGAVLMVVPLSAGDYAGKATIRRDTYGVPHIAAETEEAAAYAHGYATAEDHFPMLARFFLRARGELASVFGEQSVEDDMQVLELGIWETSREHFGDLPPLMRGILDGYAAGYNQYLSELGARAPSWARPVTGVDVLAHCRAVYLLNFSPTPTTWRRGTPAPAGASNVWAIGREKSRSGHGMLLANPHLPWKAPYLFHEVHLTVPGKINVAGATLIGFPVVTTGFNEFLGWGHAAGGGQVELVYKMTLDPADPSRYIYNGRSLPLSKTTRTLRVSTPSGEQTRHIDVWHSHHGPIIRTHASTAWAFKSPNLRLVNFLTQYNLMAKAKSLAEFKLALSMQQLPSFNIGYADREGNIFYVHNGRFPALPASVNGGPLDGDRDDTEWHLLHPFAALPQLLNPRGGYVQSANNGVAFTTLQERLDPTIYPASMGVGGELRLRAQRSLELLEDVPQMTIDDVVRAQFDTEVPAAARLKTELATLAQGRIVDGVDLTDAAGILQAWDNQIVADRPGAPLFVKWWTDYLRERRGQAFRERWDPKRPTETPSGIADPNLAATVLARVVRDVSKHFGRLSVPWGEVYRIRRGKVDAAAPGASDSLGFFNCLEYQHNDQGRHTAVAGTSYALAVEFTPVPTAFSVVPYSQSSEPTSAHFDDQTAVYARGSLKRFWMADADIDKHVIRRYSPGASTRRANPTSADGLDARVRAGHQPRLQK